MKKIKLLFGICLLTLSSVAQDIHFSQFWMTPLLINPAQAGAEHDLRAIVNYKNQWGSVAAPYSTANLSVDMKLKKKKGAKGFSALGITIFNDNAGDDQMKTLQGNLAFAYHVYLTNKSTLGAGLYGGFAQRSISYSNLQWMNQYDGTSYNAALPSGEPSAGSSFTHLDLGGGLHYDYNSGEKYITKNDHKSFSAGIALFHANQPKYSFYGTGEKLNIKMVGYANALIGIRNTNVSVVPGVTYLQQGKATELLVGSMLRYQLKEESRYTGYVKGSSLSIGSYYRNKDAMVATMQFEISQYTIGVSYDVNVSKLKTASNGRGGFEISLRFVNPNPFLYKNTSRS